MALIGILATAAAHLCFECLDSQLLRVDKARKRKKENEGHTQTTLDIILKNKNCMLLQGTLKSYYILREIRF